MFSTLPPSDDILELTLSRDITLAVYFTLTKRMTINYDYNLSLAKPVLRILIVDITSQDKQLVQIYIYYIVK